MQCENYQTLFVQRYAAELNTAEKQLHHKKTLQEQYIFLISIPHVSVHSISLAPKSENLV